jgi:uncharacterized membrane protein
MRVLRYLLSALVVVLLVLYPLVVYLGLAQYGPRVLAYSLLIVASAKLIITKFTQQALGNTAWLLLAAMIACGITLFTGSVLGLKFYPVLVNLVLLGVFSISLWRPPTMIERFARLRQADLSSHAIAYTRKVTWVWCGFFIVNGTMATASVFVSDQMWAIYNGLVAYGLIALLLGGEYLVRLRVQRQHAQSEHAISSTHSTRKLGQHD